MIKTFLKAFIYSSKKLSQFLLGVILITPGLLIFCCGVESQSSFEDLSAIITGIVLMWIGGFLVYKSTQE